jgi:hypothetical protein
MTHSCQSTANFAVVHNGPHDVVAWSSAQRRALWDDSRTMSRKPAKTRRGRTTKPKRSNAPTAAPPASSTLADLQEQVSALTRELAEAREQQTATSEVLQVISSSPGELDPVFQAMLENAIRICAAKFGFLWFADGDGFRAVG